MLLGAGGREFLLLPLLNYAGNNYDHLYDMMSDPVSLQGLGDGGAHCGIICDASMTTYLLSHWVGKRTRGPRLSLETAVHRLTGDPAGFYGLGDRGALAPGRRADVNLIDLDRLRLHYPNRVEDLPGRRGATDPAFGRLRGDHGAGPDRRRRWRRRRQAGRPGPGASPVELEATRSEIGRLINHPRLHILPVCGGDSLNRSKPGRWERTDIDRFGGVRRSDRDWRLVDNAHELARRLSEESDRGDVVSDLGRHWLQRLDEVRPIGNLAVGHEAHHGRTLRIPSQHDLGFRATRCHGLHMSACIADAVDRRGEIGGGRVVDRIHPERLRSDVRLQCVHEILTNAANAGRLGGAAGEHDLNVWARLRSRGRDGRDEQRPNRCRRSANEVGERMCLHIAMLSQCDHGCRVSGFGARSQSCCLCTKELAARHTPRTA